MSENRVKGPMSNDHPQPLGTEHWHECGRQGQGWPWARTYYALCNSCGFTSRASRHKEVVDALSTFHTMYPFEPIPTELLL